MMALYNLKKLLRKQILWEWAMSMQSVLSCVVLHQVAANDSISDQMAKLWAFTRFTRGFFQSPGLPLDNNKKNFASILARLPTLQGWYSN